MGLQRLEHFLVLTHDVDATRNFYTEVLGFEPGFRPDLEFAGCWLYLDGIPVVHIAELSSYRVWTQAQGIPVSTGPYGSGALDHLAFNASGFDTVKAHLEAQGMELSCNILDEIGLRQIFLHDPNGLGIELNFREQG